MQSKDKRIEQMLTQHIETSPQLLPIELNNIEFIKKRLKIMRGMTRAYELSLQEIEELSEAETRRVATTYQSMMASKSVTQPLKRNNIASFFLHQLPQDYPFTYDIISTKVQSPVNGNTVQNGNNKSLSATQNQVHGCPLKDDESFSSSRYYSDDKSQYGRIIARPGKFQIEHQNLNEEQKTDLALETAFQFLLSMEPGNKDIIISGTPQMTHKLNAAFLYYQEQYGPLFKERFPNLKIHLPEGIGLKANQTQEDYIKEHLGTMNPVPQQASLLQTFLTQNKVQKNTETMEALVNLDKCISAPDLDEHDKTMLKAYQVALQQHLENHDRVYLPDFISQEKNFIEQTQNVLECIKKSPGLEKETNVLKLFYDLIVKEHQKLVKESEALDKEHQVKMDPLLQELKKAHLGMIQVGIKETGNILKLSIPKGDSKDMMNCLEQLKQLEGRLNELNPQSQTDYQNIVIKFHRLVDEADKMTERSIPYLKEMKKAMEDIIITFPNIEAPKASIPIDTLQNNHTQIAKDKLGKMKSESEDKITLSLDEKQELTRLFDKISQLVSYDEELKNNSAYKKLLKIIPKNSEFTKTNSVVIIKSIDTLLPKTQNDEVKKAFLEVKSIVTTLKSDKILQEENEQKLSL